MWLVQLRRPPREDWLTIGRFLWEDGAQAAAIRLQETAGAGAEVRVVEA